MQLALILGLAGACGSTTDERPATFEVVTLEVLAPTCGQVMCHSTTTRTEHCAFDTLEAARETLTDASGGCLPADVLTALQEEDAEKRMPPDVPFADEDFNLVYAWILAGTPGL